MNPEMRARLERQRIDELAEAWREIARGAPPWEAIEVDGRAVLLDTRERLPLGSLEGKWTPGVARYLNAIHPRAGVALAELLWNIGGHGNPIAIQHQAVDLLRAMGLEDAAGPSARGRS